jgi:hypothetical protein
MLVRWNTRMYSTICKNQHAIISAIPQTYVQKYESLLQPVGRANNPQYQRDYKKFWQMNLAQMGSTFHQKYFNALNTTKPLTLRGLCKMLYPYSKRRKGTPTLQFSFPTKLRHMIKPQLPIYDKKVVRFFLFQEPSTKLPWEQRLNGYIVFHNFLIREYRRVIGCGQLATAIAAFHQQFHPQQHTEEKIIDWLILTFVELADKGQINW